MTTRIYRYVYERLKSEELHQQHYEDLMLERVVRAYRCNWPPKGVIRKKISYLGANTRRKRARIALMQWLGQVTPEELEVEFNSHEIMELLSKDECKTKNNRSVE